MIKVIEIKMDSLFRDLDTAIKALRVAVMTIPLHDKTAQRMTMETLAALCETVIESTRAVCDMTDVPGACQQSSEELSNSSSTYLEHFLRRSLPRCGAENSAGSPRGQKEAGHLNNATVDVTCRMLLAESIADVACVYGQPKGGEEGFALIGGYGVFPLSAVLPPRVLSGKTGLAASIVSSRLMVSHTGGPSSVFWKEVPSMVSGVAVPIIASHANFVLIVGRCERIPFGAYEESLCHGVGRMLHHYLAQGVSAHTSVAPQSRFSHTQLGLYSAKTMLDPRPAMIVHRTDPKVAIVAHETVEMALAMRFLEETIAAMRVEERTFHAIKDSLEAKILVYDRKESARNMEADLISKRKALQHMQKESLKVAVDLTTTSRKESTGCHVETCNVATNTDWKEHRSCPVQTNVIASTAYAAVETFSNVLNASRVPVRLSSAARRCNIVYSDTTHTAKPPPRTPRESTPRHPQMQHLKTPRPTPSQLPSSLDFSGKYPSSDALTGGLMIGTASCPMMDLSEQVVFPDRTQIRIVKQLK